MSPKPPTSYLTDRQWRIVNGEPDDPMTVAEARDVARLVTAFKADPKNQNMLAGVPRETRIRNAKYMRRISDLL